MTTPRIYCPIPIFQNHQIELPSDACQHVLQVLRCRVGHIIHIFNAEDGEFTAKITDTQRKRVIVQVQAAVINSKSRESPLRVHLGQAISRGERMDYALQKAVELGIAAITPIFTTRCNVKLDQERVDKKLLHWQKVVISACEQCGRTQIPSVHSPQEWSTWLAQTPGCGIVCYPQANPQPLPTEIMQQVKLLIGPEGGLTADEIAAAVHHFDCVSLTLGPRILRTETATVVALTLLQQHWGDIN